MGIPQLVLSNTLLLNGALFLGIVALHSIIEDSQIDANWISVVLLALALIISSLFISVSLWFIAAVHYYK